MKVSLSRRERIGRYFLNLVRMKIAGEITQAELEQRSSQRPEEQLLLGICTSMPYTHLSTVSPAGGKNEQ